MSMISSRHYAWRFLTGDFYSHAVRAVTGILITVLCLWMIAGIINMLMGFMTIPESGWTGLAEHTIISSLIMLALIEVIRTLQAYLTLGRVRVTFILDTALVVLIGELMGLWFRKYAPEKVLLGLGAIIALVMLRIVTAKFSPKPHGL